MTLQYNNKPLASLDLEEVLEYEKSVHKKILAADRSDMSQSIVEQMQGFLALIRLHKDKCINEFVESNNNDDGVLNIGEIEQESTDDTE